MRSEDLIPQEYFDEIMPSLLPPKRHEPQTDGELDGSDELKAIQGRLAGREMPRFGQPSMDAPLVEWYREYQFRNANPFWYEREYRRAEDGTLIHGRRGHDG